MTTPVMLSNIGYKTYIVFMCFCITGFVYSVFILPELKGLSLEEVDAVFKDTSNAEDAARRERVAKEIGLDKIAARVVHNDDATLAGAEGVKSEKVGPRTGARSEDV